MFYPPYVLQGHWRIPPFNTSLSSGVIPYQMSANPIVPISIALLINYRTHRCVLGFHGDWWRIRLHSPLWSSYVRYLRQKGYFYTTNQHVLLCYICCYLTKAGCMAHKSRFPAIVFHFSFKWQITVICLRTCNKTSGLSIYNVQAYLDLCQCCVRIT